MLRELLLDAGDVSASPRFASRAVRPSIPAPPMVEKQSPMSVDEFRRLVQELYLEPEESAENARRVVSACNIAVLVDTSGSMEHHDPQLAVLKASLVRLAAKLAGYGAQGMRINFCLIGFSERITLTHHAAGLADFAEDASDPLYRAVQALRARGGTNYEAAFRAAGTWFENCGETSADLVFFITDGKPTCYYHDGFTHCIPASKAGMHMSNGTEFGYGGKGRIYYDAAGRTVSSNSGARKYRASEDGSFEVRVGSSLNWSAARAVFTPQRPARRVSCMLPERYAPGVPLYYDAAGNVLPGTAGAAYRVSAGGNFEQLRKGAWHDPDGVVFASVLDDEGTAHTHPSTRVLGGNGTASGCLESGKSVLARREMERRAKRLSLFALGIGGVVDVAFLNLFDSMAQAQVLSDVSQLTAALTGLVDDGFKLAVPEFAPGVSDVSDTPYAADMYEVDDAFAAPHSAHGADMPPVEPSRADMPEHAAFADSGMFLRADPELLTELGNGLLAEADSPELVDTVFGGQAALPEEVTVVRHFNLGTDHLDLRDVLGTRETLDDLLSRITTGQEIRTVNGEEVADLVLQIHSGSHAQNPVVQTIVLEDFGQLNPDAPDDVHFLLQQLLYG